MAALGQHRRPAPDDEDVDQNLSQRSLIGRWRPQEAGSTTRPSVLVQATSSSMQYRTARHHSQVAQPSGRLLGSTFHARETMASRVWGVWRTPEIVILCSRRKRGRYVQHAESPMHQLPSELRRCIEECQNCHSVCLSTASVHCLEVGGQHVSPKHFRLMLDCAEICETSANFMLRNSQHHAIVCRVCAEICEACAKSCQEIGDMDECVDACRRCAESCRMMAS